MEKDEKEKAPKNNESPETSESLKTESTKVNPEQKGYNEHNPSQNSGAFTPDSKTADDK